MKRRSFSVVFLFAFAALGCVSWAADSRLTYAERLLADAGLKDRVSIRFDEKLGGAEAFRIVGEGRRVTLTAGGPAGVIYGAQEIVRRQALRRTFDHWSESEKPDFALRGNALFLMKDASYNFQLTPKEFPWFYDRRLLTQYLDYLCENRFNAIFLWSGCLWPSIVEMPEYPDATDLSHEQVQQNQEQFRWFTDECAKRNISVLMHFYNIQIPGPMAKARNIPLNYGKPTEFTVKLINYCLTRFLTEFKSVGLYVCPGEALDARYTAQWINDVIFSAAKACGHNPTIVVRDWGLDAEGFTKQCIGKYDNLYTELKHNIEMIVSPVPDTRHQIWRGLGIKHIVNLHEVSDVKPFRWGSPTFVHEMVEEWRKAGIDGAEVYSMVSWRWPYTCDKLEPSQSGFWPAGPKLVTFERDAIWLESVGRYLWKVDRRSRDEAVYWRDDLAAKFGSRKAGEALRRWYDVTGPILPGMQDLASVLNMNYHPTVVGLEETVDAILAARVPAGSKDRPKSNYVSKPVDTAFFEAYKKEYRLPQLTDRISMPVSEFALEVAAGQSVDSKMTPDKIMALMEKQASQAVDLARQAARAATANKEEAERYVTDSEALLLVVEAWRHKVGAAVQKGAWRKTGKQEYADSCLRELNAAVSAYENLVALTDRTYLNPTDMLTSLNWHNGFSALKADLALQEKELGPKVK